MNREDYYPLFDAIEGGDVAAVESFLQTPGVEVDFLFEMDEHGEMNLCTPLNWAILDDHKNIVEVLLLAHGAAVNGVDGADNTPLQEACDLIPINADIVKLLLEQEADVDGMTEDDRRTPLTIACYSENNLGIIQLLLNAGADVNGAGGELAPLHLASHFGNTEAIELFIEAGVVVNRVTIGDFGSGSTALHFAASQDQLPSMTILLAAGADSNIANAEGKTPLHNAALRSSNVSTLLAAGSDPLHRDNSGRTPLQHCHEKYDNIGFSANNFNTITALVAAGDHSWECVPTPCRGLEAAIVSVMRNAPEELPELFKRLDDEMKKVVQEVLRVLHHHFSSFPHLKEHLLNSIFGLPTSI